MSGNEHKFIQEAFDTNWVVPLGPNVNAFEQELKEFVGENKEIVALSSGTAALHLALLVLEMRLLSRVLHSVRPQILLHIWGQLLYLWIRSRILGIWIQYYLRRLLKIVL